MKNKNKHNTLKEIIDSLDNETTREAVFTQLKNTDPVDDEVKGVKLFLENNNYNYQLLQGFINDSKPNFNTLLQDKKKTTSNRNWLKYAAILIPLLGIGYFMMDRTSNNLYSTFYEREVGLPVTMGNTHKIVFNEAMNTFKDNEFKEALLGFNDLLEHNPSNDTLLYFIGCANLELENLDKAILSFNEVNEPLLLKEKSEYRLVLVYLKKEDYQSAKKVLQQIAANKNHRYNAVALTILKEPVFK